MTIDNDYAKLAAAEMASLANSCCYRSDGWEEELAKKFENIINEAINKKIEEADEIRKLSC